LDDCRWRRLVGVEVGVWFRWDVVDEVDVDVGSFTDSVVADVL